MPQDVTDSLEFSPIDGAAGKHVHVYLGGHYLARITQQPNGYLVASNHFCGAVARSEADAREVVRMWVGLTALAARGATVFTTSRGMNMHTHGHPQRIFGEGHAFQTADGVIYRVKSAVTVNGVDLIVYEAIRGNASPEPAAIPVDDFAKMLTAQGAVLCRDPMA